MSLRFPNASRSYDAAKRCVNFWGHDSTFEIAFQLEEDALTRMSPDTAREETALLRAFDTNRVRIERAAGAAYAQRRQNYLRLSASDF
jgi:hypothetical protein